MIRFDTEHVLKEEGLLADFKDNKKYLTGMRGQKSDDIIEE